MFLTRNKLKMLKIKKRTLLEYALYSSIISLGIIFDQITKWLASEFLTKVETCPIIKGVIHLTYVENTGAAFGSFKDHRWIFMVTSSVMIVGLAVYLYFGYAETKLCAAAVAMIISGGIGNMIDRLAFGFVVDFIDFRIINFAVFNVADSFVCVGAALLAIAMIQDIRREAAAAKESKKDEEKK